MIAGVIVPRARERLGRFMRWEYKEEVWEDAEQGGTQEGYERIYVSGIIRRDMERAGAMIEKDRGEGEVKTDG